MPPPQTGERAALPTSGPTNSAPPSASPGLPLASVDLCSFDGGTQVRANVVRPDRSRQWAAIGNAPLITPRGGGYSYAPVGVGTNGELHVDMRAWSRLLDFDRSTGLMHAEVGATLGDVHRVASPHRWHLPSQPGYPEITIGGAIAADVHGKNQHQLGNFRNCVKSLEVWHPDHGLLELFPGDPVFELTVGGFGLTGIIRSAKLQLHPLESNEVEVTITPITDARDTVRVLRETSDSLFSYTWQNLTTNRRTGRGFAYAGRFRNSTDASVGRDRYPVIDPLHRGWPIGLLGRPTAVVMNAAYFLVESRRRQQTLPLFDFLFPAAGRANYFRAFGPRGFHEVQMLAPDDTAADLLSSIAEAARRSKAPVTLMSCKRFQGEPRYLRFDGTGTAIAVDVPRSTSGSEFVKTLHGLMVEFSARPNLAKDSALDRDVVEQTVDGIDDFRCALRDYDPQRRFRSTFSDRFAL